MFYILLLLNLFIFSLFNTFLVDADTIFFLLQWTSVQRGRLKKRLEYSILSVLNKVNLVNS